MCNTQLLSRPPTFTPVLTLIALFLLPLAGCHKTVDDATLTANVKTSLSSDSAISQQPVQVVVQQGVVTLNGNVTDDTARSVASQDAVAVKGVKQVVNDLTVAGLAVAPTVIVPSAPTVARPTTHQEQVAIARHESLPPPPDNAPPPPQPVFHNVTVQAGTPLSIRITESLDSQTAQSGDSFSGVLTRELDADGYLVLPAGAAVSGRVVEAKDATHFKGSSLLSIQITSVRRHGDLISVSTEPYTLEGKGRGSNTAEKVGGGAVVGAVLGGIFGGGKGAAIGAGAGAGGGAAIQGFTRGQQVVIPSEIALRFRLASPLTVHTAEAASSEEDQPAGLQTR